MRSKKDVIEEKTIAEVNYKLLKEHFPNAVTIDDDGKYVIDANKLQMLIDPSKAIIQENGYGLNWIGKKEAYNKTNEKNYKILKPLIDNKFSRNWDKTCNILIKGDNLDALKILRNNYANEIKMIYIDPPYNTKNDGFVYKDNFSSTDESVLEQLGYDKQDMDYIENIYGAKTHSGWLSFMYPRLQLARELLRNDGLICVSIDDNEVAQLKLLMDEIYDEANFVGEIIRKTKSMTADTSVGFNLQHESVLIYAKQKASLVLLGDEKELDKYANPDNDPKGDWVSSDPSAKSGGSSTNFGITNPYTKKIDYPPTGRYWAFSESTLQTYIKEGKIKFKKEYKSGERGFIFKRYKNELKNTRNPINSLFAVDNAFMNQVATKELKQLFGEEYFSNPKPLNFIKNLIAYSTNEQDIIMDFFAGSGTTAHALMQLNAENSDSKRKYILVQSEEPTPTNSKAKEDGYKTIFDITMDRIRKAGDKIQSGDVGFRTYAVVEDAKQKIYQKSLEEVAQEDLLKLAENIGEGNKDILPNLLVAEGLFLDVQLQTLIEEKVFKAENYIFILQNVDIEELLSLLNKYNDVEYITVYSPNISSDRFTLELESAIASLGISSEKLKFRG